MKILKRPPTNGEQTTREIANQGCSTCPFCGRTGITSGVYSTWHDGFGTSAATMRTDMYGCVCGGEWESEPYEV